MDRLQHIHQFSKERSSHFERRPPLKLGSTAFLNVRPELGICLFSQAFVSSKRLTRF